MKKESLLLNRFGAAIFVVALSSAILARVPGNAAADAVVPADFDSRSPERQGGFQITPAELGDVSNFLRDVENSSWSDPSISQLMDALDMSSAESFNRSMKENSLEPLLAQIVRNDCQVIAGMTNKGILNKKQLAMEVNRLAPFKRLVGARHSVEALQPLVQAKNMRLAKQMAAALLENSRRAAEPVVYIVAKDKPSKARLSPAEEKKKVFFKAIEDGYVWQVKNMVNDVGANARLGGIPALNWASSNGNSQHGNHAVIVELLLNHGADVLARDSNGRTALIAASMFPLTSPALAMLIDHKAEVNAKDKDGKTALMWAAETGDGASVSVLLSNKADIEERDRSGATPLMHAAARGDVAMINLLIKLGAYVDSEDKKGKTARAYAERAGREKAAASLLATENLIEDLYRNRPLWEIKHDLAAGANVNARDGFYNGNSAVKQAAQGGNAEILKLLVERGADVNAKNSFGETALGNAEFRGPEIVELLINHGANVDEPIRDGSKETPLILAAEYNYLPVAEVLLKHGAGKLREAFFMAMSKGNLKMAWLIVRTAVDRVNPLPRRSFVDSAKDIANLF